MSWNLSDRQSLLLVALLQAEEKAGTYINWRTVGESFGFGKQEAEDIAISLSRILPFMLNYWVAISRN